MVNESLINPVAEAVPWNPVVTGLDARAVDEVPDMTICSIQGPQESWLILDAFLGFIARSARDDCGALIVRSENSRPRVYVMVAVAGWIIVVVTAIAWEPAPRTVDARDG